MPAEGIEKDITNRMERWTGQANGMARQESRSIVGASIVRNQFQGDVDPNGALTQVNSLALASVPSLPPGTLPPVVLPYRSDKLHAHRHDRAEQRRPRTSRSLYDVGRYEVRNMIMANPGAVAPVVYGGKVRAVMLYMDRVKMQARGLSPLDVMRAMDNYNVFLPTGDAKFGSRRITPSTPTRCTTSSTSMGDMPASHRARQRAFLKDVATPKDDAFIQTNIVRIGDAKGPSRKQVYIPIFRQLGASTLKVIDTLKSGLLET